MKQQRFEFGDTVGVSKGYQNVITLLRCLKQMRVGRYAWTAYDLAPMVDLTPQHVNRLLNKMFNDGKVEFRPVLSKRGQPAREWWAI